MQREEQILAEEVIRRLSLQYAQTLEGFEHLHSLDPASIYIFH